MEVPGPLMDAPARRAARPSGRPLLRSAMMVGLRGLAAV